MDMGTSKWNTTSSSHDITYQSIQWDRYPDSQWFSWNIGLVIGAAAYGALCTLCILIFMALQHRARQQKREHGHISAETAWMFVYILWICILCSGLLAVEMEASLPHPAVAGGTNNAFQNIFSGLPPSIVGVACSALIHWGVQILFTWRSYIIYRNSKKTMFLFFCIAGPVFLASLISGSLFLIEVVMHDFKDTILLLTVFGATCLASNLIFTNMIVIRLYLYRRHIIKLVGRQHASRYTSLTSIFIESALLMNLLLAFTLVTVALRSNWVALPLLTFSLTEALSSYIIVFRVALGSAWTSGTANKLIAQHGRVGVRSTVILSDNPQLSAMRYRASQQATEASTAFRFDHQMASPSRPTSQRSSQQSYITDPEMCAMSDTSQISDENILPI